MRFPLVSLAALSFALVLPVACSEDDPPAAEPSGGASGAGGTAGGGGTASGSAGAGDGVLPPAKAETTETKTYRLARPVGDLAVNKLPNPSVPEGYAQADTDYALLTRICG